MLACLRMNHGVKNDPQPIEWNHLIKSSSTHAEMNAIVHYLHQKKILGRRKKHSEYNIIQKFPKTLFVVSLYKGQLRNSRPCNDCILVMRMYGIKRVIYSTGNIDEPYHMESVATMPFLCQSSGNRCMNH